ncbi:MAG: nicotinate phosphoribosyltransferase [Clostridiales bacterium]|nr:nicotinate phosphoribosyltransferase [Clostridiales bacterium]
MRNLTMMTDLYQLTMMYGYYKNNKINQTVVFDMFYRQSNLESSYAIAAGLEQIVEYIDNLHFDENDIEYLRGLNLFDEGFFDELRRLRFTGEMYAVPEGSVVFPTEPILRVKARLFEAQFIETAILNIVNHQTLIATKASRVVLAAQGDAVMEFGLRRAQGPDAGIYGARAAIIGGCASTSNVLTAQLFEAQCSGTHSHSWVMSFGSELEAFRAYAASFPNACLLLVDTYDTLKSGVPNAIKVFNELREKGYEPMGIRLDSGDLAYLSKEARKMLDNAGFPNVKIVASNDLDEDTIWDLKAQGAKIDTWGVGTSLITSRNCPALGGVYKLSAYEENGKLTPCLKVSENVNKMTDPGYKKLVRIYEKKTGKAIADLIMLDHEQIDTKKPLTIFHPVDTWKKTVITDYTIREMLEPVYINGEKKYTPRKVLDIREYARKELDTFWEEYKRIVRPNEYKVDLSQELYDLKHRLLHEYGKEN